MRKVKPGDPLVIRAADWNQFVDAVEFVKGVGQGTAGQWGRILSDRDVMLVKNSTGGDLDRFGVMSITGVTFTPTDNPDGFKNAPALVGQTPSGDQAGDFVIALTPIKSGAFGPCVMSGLTVAYLDVIDAAHKYADTKSADKAKLRTYDTGRAQIVWAESGTGPKWAVVRVGIEPPAGLWGKAPGSDPASPAWVTDGTARGNGCYVNVNPCKRDGASPDTAVTHKVWLPRNGRREDPNVREGDVISYQREPGGDFVNPSGLLDGKVNETVRIHLDAGNVPPGWSITHKGQVLVGYHDADPDGDYAAVGGTYGFKWHGDNAKGNNHEDHDPRIVGGFGDYGWSETGIKGFVDGSWEHSQTDNRPPETVVVWIKRTS